MQITFINYFLASIVVYLGLLLGIILIKLAPEEQRLGKKYFIFLKMFLFFLIISFFLLYYKANIISLVLLAFILILMLNKKIHLEKSAFTYALFGIIFYLSNKTFNLFVIESILILLYGIPNASLIFIPRKNNYKEVFIKNLWFFVPVLVLYWFKV